MTSRSKCLTRKVLLWICLESWTKPELAPIISAIRNVQPTPAVPDCLTPDLGIKLFFFFSQPNIKPKLVYSQSTKQVEHLQRRHHYGRSQEILCPSFKDSGTLYSCLSRIQERPLSFLSGKGDVLPNKMLQAFPKTYTRNLYQFKPNAVEAGSRNILIDSLKDTKKTWRITLFLHMYMVSLKKLR